MSNDTTLLQNALQGNETGTDRDTDEVFEAMKHRHRRNALAALREHDEALALADLAFEVARRETGEADRDRIDRARELEIALYHVHVPKLADAGLVRFDRDRNVVSPADVDQSVVA